MFALGVVACDSMPRPQVTKLSIFHFPQSFRTVFRMFHHFPEIFCEFPICKTSGASTTSSKPSCPFSAQLPYPLRGPSSLSLCGHDLARLRLDAATRRQSPWVEPWRWKHKMVPLPETNMTRWWQLKYFWIIFTPKIGEDEPNLTNIFQIGSTTN